MLVTCPNDALVVAVAIPLVLAGTFLFMEYSGITLQRISLGALIIALGLLVDDAMISVEMMVARREEGDSLEKAATFAYTSTAFPMLTGTLVTVAGFVPIGLNGSSAGEYTFTLFAVIAAALLISWVVAVLFTPLLGVTLLPRTARSEKESRSWLKLRLQPVLLFALITGIIAALQYFTEASVASQVASGKASVGAGVGDTLGYPDNSLLTYTQWLYERGFGEFQLGYASALAVILFIVAGLFLMILLRRVSAFNPEGAR